MSVFVLITCGWPPMAGCGGNVTPAKSGLVGVGVRNTPPFGIHHFLSPVFMSYAVTPPICFGFRIETPSILLTATLRPDPTWVGA